MIPLFGEAAIAIGGSLALSVIVKATIVSTGVLIAVRVARRAPASVRHLLLASGFAVLLALPVATLTVPEVELGVPTQPVRAVPNVGTPGTADIMSPAVSSPDDVGLSPVVPARRVLSLGMVLLIVWIIGVATVLARVIADMLWVRRVRRQARPWSRGEAIVAGISGSSSIRSRTRILLDETAAGPITCGVFRPAIVFPGEACAWDAEELRRAVIHELEHVRRADLLMFCVARIVCALYWFHPLVWVSWRRLRLEAERACDDAVLRGFEPVEYADQLVTLAERLVSRRIETVPAMADRTDLSVRISAVLDPQQRRGRAGLRLVAFVSMVAILVVAAVSSLRAVPQSSNPLDAAARARFEVASIKPTKQCAVFGGSPTPGRVSTCGALAFMIQGAYDVYTKGRGFKPGVMTVAWTANIEGAPAWLQSELYQIEAKAAGNPPQIVMNGPMMQALFEDRLKLKTHLETRNVPVYELTVVRGGPKLQRAETDCVPFDPMKPLVEPTFPGQESPKPRLCGGFAIGKGTMDFTETTISDFAQYLGRNIVRRPVIDKVGIAGRFNFHLQFAPDENTPLLSRSDAVTGPSIFTAMQEQLGLKLEPATGPHEFLVIDSVDRPSDN
jgi:bla regulator protein blaR1